MVRSRGSGSSGETKTRILDAAEVVLLRDGLVGATARAIAAEGSFNQALVFYHFGSVDELLIATVERSTHAQLLANRERLAQVETLGELVGAALELRASEEMRCSLGLTTQLIAAAGEDAEFTSRLRDLLQPVMDDVADAVDRVAEGTPFEGVVPAKEASWAVSAMFYGMLLLERVDEEEMTERVFGALAGLSQLVDPLIQARTAPPLA